MNYFNAVLHHPDFMQAVALLREKEATRIFCRHGLDHFMDVARIAWIICLEEGLTFPKEEIYLTALLHDIGRSQDAAHHDEASVSMAKAILKSCSVPEDIIARVLEAISSHRQKLTSFNPKQASMGELIAWADKRSRLCFQCPAQADCYWPASQKNMTIFY